MDDYVLPLDEAMLAQFPRKHVLLWRYLHNPQEADLPDLAWRLRLNTKRPRRGAEGKQGSYGFAPDNSISQFATKQRQHRGRRAEIPSDRGQQLGYTLNDCYGSRADIPLARKNPVIR